MGKYSSVGIYSSLSLLQKDVHALSISDVLHDFVLFVQLKKCEKHLWRNATFSKFAGLHYSWKYHIRMNYNSFYCNYILIVSRIIRSHQSRTLTFQKECCYLLHSKLFKTDEKCVLFHLKNSFRSHDI